MIKIMEKENLNLNQGKRNLIYMFVVSLYKNNGNIEKTIKDFNDNIHNESEKIKKLINEEVKENLKDTCKNEIFKIFQNNVVEALDIFFDEKTGLITNNKHEELEKLMKEAVEYHTQRLKQIEDEKC